ncbi:hypothetical protein D3C87_1228640 [compost metagenome]
MLLHVVEQPAERHDHQHVADIDRVAEFADRLVQAVPGLEQECQRQQRREEHDREAIAHRGIYSDREVQQAVDKQDGRTQFRQTLNALGPGLHARQQHLVRQRAYQEQRQLRGEEAIGPRIGQADAGCDEHSTQGQRCRQQDQQAARRTQHEGRHQVEAHLHAQGPGLGHEQALIQRHIAVRETARERQRGILDTEEHQPVLAQDENIGKHQEEFRTEGQGVVDPEEGAAAHYMGRQRHCGDGQVDREQAQEAIRVELAHRALVMVRGRQHE